MVEDDLPFGARTARRFMAIADCVRLRTHASVLPSSWMTLYELSRLDDYEWAAIEPHLSPELQRKDIKGLLPKAEPEPSDAEPEPPPTARSAEPAIVAAGDLTQRQRDMANAAYRRWQGMTAT
jgi:hypothetical protein